MVKRKKTVDVLKFLADMTKNNATYIDTRLLCAVFRECYYPTKKQPLEEVRNKQEMLLYRESIATFRLEIKSDLSKNATTRTVSNFDTCIDVPDLHIGLEVTSDFWIISDTRVSELHRSGGAVRDSPSLMYTLHDDVHLQCAMCNSF